LYSNFNVFPYLVHTKKNAENTYITGYSIGLASRQKQDDSITVVFTYYCMELILCDVFIFTSMPLTAVVLKNTAIYTTDPMHPPPIPMELWMVSHLNSVQ
jgi:hypothetical protein